MWLGLTSNTKGFFETEPSCSGHKTDDSSQSWEIFITQLGASGLYLCIMSSFVAPKRPPRVSRRSPESHVLQWRATPVCGSLPGHLALPTRPTSGLEGLLKQRFETARPIIPSLKPGLEMRRVANHPVTPAQTSRVEPLVDEIAQVPELGAGLGRLVLGAATCCCPPKALSVPSGEVRRTSLLGSAS